MFLCASPLCCPPIQEIPVSDNEISVSDNEIPVSDNALLKKICACTLYLIAIHKQPFTCLGITAASVTWSSTFSYIEKSLPQFFEKSANVLNCLFQTIHSNGLKENSCVVNDLENQFNVKINREFATVFSTLLFASHIQHHSRYIAPIIAFLGGQALHHYIIRSNNTSIDAQSSLQNHENEILQSENLDSKAQEILHKIEKVIVHLFTIGICNTALLARPKIFIPITTISAAMSFLGSALDQKFQYHLGIFPMTSSTQTISGCSDILETVFNLKTHPLLSFLIAATLFYCHTTHHKTEIIPIVAFLAGQALYLKFKDETDLDRSVKKYLSCLEDTYTHFNLLYSKNSEIEELKKQDETRLRTDLGKEFLEIEKAVLKMAKFPSPSAFYLSQSDRGSPYCDGGVSLPLSFFESRIILSKNPRDMTEIYQWRIHRLSQLQMYRADWDQKVGKLEELQSNLGNNFHYTPTMEKVNRIARFLCTYGLLGSALYLNNKVFLFSSILSFGASYIDECIKKMHDSDRKDSLLNVIKKFKWITNSQDTGSHACSSFLQQTFFLKMDLKMASIFATVLFYCEMEHHRKLVVPLLGIIFGQWVSFNRKEAPSEFNFHSIEELKKQVDKMIENIKPKIGPPSTPAPSWLRKKP